MLCCHRSHVQHLNMALHHTCPLYFFRSSCIFGLWMVTSELANVGWSNFGIFCCYWRDFTHPINNGQQPDSCLHILYPVWGHLPYHDYSCQVSCLYLYSTLFKPLYFLGVRGLTTSFCIVCDYTLVDIWTCRVYVYCICNIYTFICSIHTLLYNISISSAIKM